MTTQAGPVESATGAPTSAPSGSNNNAKPLPPLRKLVVKTGPVRYEVTEQPSGVKIEQWFTNGMVATIVPGAAAPSVAASGASQSSYSQQTNDHSKSDFDGFDWISKKNYIGAVQLGGGTCIVFHTGSEAGVAPPPGGAAPLGRTAYITSDTRLPVILQNEDNLTTYEFRTPPNSVLPVPAAVQTAISAVVQRQQSAAAQPAGP